MLSYLLACIGTAGAFYGLFAAADDALAPEKKREISLFLSKQHTPNYSMKWGKAFISVFDSVFTEKHLSFKCFLMNCISSLVAITVLGLFWWQTDPSGVFEFMSWYGKPEFILTILAPVIINFLPDYISLLQTRYILKRFNQKGSVYIFVGFDLLITWLIATLAYFVGVFLLSSLEDGRLDLSVFDFLVDSYTREVISMKVDEIGIPIGVLFYSTFFTSVWIWLYIAATSLARIFDSFIDLVPGYLGALNVKEFPLKSIGFIVMILVLAIYLVAAPFVLPSLSDKAV